MIADTINAIKPIDEFTGKKVGTYIETIIGTKESLGRLEELAITLAKITSKPYPLVTPPGVLLFAADHGHQEQSVKEETRKSIDHVLTGGAPVCGLTQQMNGVLKVVDIGLATNFIHNDLVDRKIRYGTADIYHEDAMTRKEAIQAIEIGMDIAEEMINKGARCLILGSIGETSNDCLNAVVSSFEKTDDTKKEDAILQMLAKKNIDAKDPVDIISKVGGLEIAGLTGAILKAAARKIPILIDGTTGIVAALHADKFCHHVKEYIFIAQHPIDPAVEKIVNILGKKPLLDTGLQLNDGTGALLAFPLLQSTQTILIETIK